MKLVIYDNQNKLVHDENKPEYIPRKGEEVEFDGYICTITRILYNVNEKKITISLR